MGDAVFVQYTTSACSFDGSNCVRFSILRVGDCILKDIILLVSGKVTVLDLEVLDLEVIVVEVLDLERVAAVEVGSKEILCGVCDASPPHR